MASTVENGAKPVVRAEGIAEVGSLKNVKGMQKTDILPEDAEENTSLIIVEEDMAVDMEEAMEEVEEDAENTNITTEESTKDAWERMDMEEDTAEVMEEEINAENIDTTEENIENA